MRLFQKCFIFYKLIYYFTILSSHYISEITGYKYKKITLYNECFCIMKQKFNKFCHKISRVKRIQKLSSLIWKKERKNSLTWKNISNEIFFFHQKLNLDNLIANNKNEKFYKVSNANIVEKYKNVSTYRIVNILFYAARETPMQNYISITFLFDENWASTK